MIYLSDNAVHTLNYSGLFPFTKDSWGFFIQGNFIKNDRTTANKTSPQNITFRYFNHLGMTPNRSACKMCINHTGIKLSKLAGKYKKLLSAEMYSKQPQHLGVHIVVWDGKNSKAKKCKNMKKKKKEARGEQPSPTLAY